MLKAPDISYFMIGNFPIYYYGIILAIAVFVGLWISDKIATKEYNLFGIVPRVATPVIIGGIVGARLYYCLLNYGVYIKNPLEILYIREGGLSIHGAIIGGIIVLLYMAKKYHIRPLKLCDIFALGMPVAQALGRWGNFFNQEAFGTPCNLPWKLYIQPAYRPNQYFSQKYFHPTFLYESILDLIIFILLYKCIMPKYKDNLGVITATYLLLYSIVRFFIEGLRTDCVSFICGIPLPQVISILIIIAASAFLIYKKYQKPTNDNRKTY